MNRLVALLLLVGLALAIAQGCQTDHPMVYSFPRFKRTTRPPLPKNPPSSKVDAEASKPLRQTAPIDVPVIEAN